MDEPRRGRFQFSIRTLLLMTLVAAVLMVPVVWVVRERKQMVQAQFDLLLAREIALRSVVREQMSRRQQQSPALAGTAAAGPAAPESLAQENARLRQQVQELRRELDLLRGSPRTAGNPGR